MAEALELNMREISLCQWTQIKTGFIEMEEEQIKIFEEYHCMETICLNDWI